MSATTSTSPRPAEHEHAVDAAERTDFLESPLADALSIGLFALLGALVAEVMWLLPPVGRAGLAVAGAVAGPLGCAVERGHARPLGWGGALLVGAAAGLAHAAASWWLTPAPTVPLVARVLVVVALGLALARAGARLDRGEAGWRAAARRGPPDGMPPLASAIAARRLPAPARYLLLPLELPVRAALLAAIRLYQLTFSRLMPPACRFEPTCSRYGFEAVWRHGAVRGALLTALRLVRCSPIGTGGLDPVPGLHGRTPGCPGGEVSSSAVSTPPPTERRA